MVVHASYLLPKTMPPVTIMRRYFNSRALAIKNASTPHEALSLFYQMHRESTPLDPFSIVFTLKSSTHLQSPTIIRHLHSYILKLGFNTNIYIATSLLHGYSVSVFEDACKLFDEMLVRNEVTWNILITGYSRIGDVVRARYVFDNMPKRNVDSWSAMITAYVNNGDWDNGLLLFREMVARREPKPDQVTVGTVLSGCARLGGFGLQVGKSVHGFVVKNGWEVNVEIGTVLIDMYVKCGYFKNACLLFDSMPERNVTAWTALICGASQHGFYEEALSLFRIMQGEGVRANEITFTGILNACARTGMVEEGRKYFKLIGAYGLKPRIQHYGCMVDLYGKAALIKEAYEVIESMRMEPNVVIWGSFLSACKDHRRFDMAEKIIDRVLRVIMPENDGGVYSQICDLYALNGRWDDAERIRSLMLNHHVRKARGSSFI